MKLKWIAMVALILMILVQGTAQKSSSNQKFYFDTLIIQDYTTGEVSERISQMRKPLNRRFYLKSSTDSYPLFQNKTVLLTMDQLETILEEGLSLYYDKVEHKQHPQLKPGLIELLAEDGSVAKSFEVSNQLPLSVLRKELKKGTLCRLSDFMISVNEYKYGRIFVNAEIVD